MDITRPNAQAGNLPGLLVFGGDNGFGRTVGDLAGFGTVAWESIGGAMLTVPALIIDAPNWVPAMLEPLFTGAMPATSWQGVDGSLAPLRSDPIRASDPGAARRLPSMNGYQRGINGLYYPY